MATTLHGSLTVKIFNCTNLPDLDIGPGTTDPYVTVSLDKRKIAKTKSFDDNENPVFNETFEVDVNGEYTNIRFTVKDVDRVKAEFVGRAVIPLASFVNNKKGHSGEHELRSRDGKKLTGGKIKVKVSFVSYNDLVASMEVPNTIYPAREGCRVTLFQDAHIGDLAESHLPRVIVTPSAISLGVSTDGTKPDKKHKKKKSKKHVSKRDKLKDFAHLHLHHHKEDDDNDDESEKKKKKKKKEKDSDDKKSSDDKKKKKKKKKDEVEEGDKKNKKRKKSNKEKSRAAATEQPEEIRELLTGAPTDDWEYIRPNCWEKVYKAILSAKKFVYITGWSVDHTISLLREKPIFDTPRDPADNGMLTIGELLAKKANEGVNILLLLWNEATSISGEGMMMTHDERTKEYFTTHTKVKVHLAYRDGATNASHKFMWTHHQKSIILDADVLDDDDDDDTSPARDTEGEEGDIPHPTKKRRIVAFIGGLDLCDGRWDTPMHPLYRSLQTFHKNDFHQCFPGITVEYGPREPWHDIHSKIEGPIARDVLDNFEQRWKKQAPALVIDLYDIASDKDIIKISDEHVSSPNYWDSWTVQLFRSIDDYSAFLPNEEKIDKSIQKAYVHHIRRAKRFIFIENQYFIGSAEAWEDNKGKDIDCKNLVPLEIATKIEYCIENDMPFCAYIMIPMYPEGEPSSAAVQEILNWQFHTVKMMYARVYRALKKKNLLGERTVEDYLNFYCMGTRETEEGSQAIGGGYDTSKRPNQVILNASRRFAIYIHSKMMIVDDDYVIVGSANINERSLAGNRDSEIAIGAYQPHFTSEVTSNSPRGQIHAFRMGLWSSHTRKMLPCFLHPETPECARAINQIAMDNWNKFTGDQVVDMEEGGHILKYPYTWNDKGEMLVIGNMNIPDTKASFRGVDSLFLPNILTL